MRKQEIKNGKFKRTKVRITQKNRMLHHITECSGHFPPLRAMVKGFEHSSGKVKALNKQYQSR